MVKCPGCDAVMRFDPERQLLICDYCGNEQSAQTEKENKEAKGDDEFYDAVVYTCPDCGAQILSDDTTAVTFCSYCGNSVALEGRLKQLKKPELIIPFQYSIDKCKSDYVSFVKRAFFAPKRFTSDATIDKFRGIYIPYWCYDFKNETPVVFRAKRSHREGSYIITDTFAFKSTLNYGYEGIAFDAASGFADRYAGAIAPYHIDEAKPFSKGYISGFYGDAGDVPSNVYVKDASLLVRNDIENTLINDNAVKNLEYVNDSLAYFTNDEKRNERLAYFPVWFLANRYGKKVSYAVVNGQTGKLAADIPVDYLKYLLFTFLLALPIFAILNWGFYFRPGMLLIAAIIFSVIGCSLVSGQADKLYTRDNLFDDPGLQLMVYGNLAGFGDKRKKPVRISSGLIGFLIVFGSGILAAIIGAAYGANNGGDVEDSIGFAIAFAYVTFFVVTFLMALRPNKNSYITLSKKGIIPMPFGRKLKYTIKPVIAIIICICMFIVNPVLDLWYYCGAAFSMVMILWSFFDLIGLHNRMTLRMPPQFNKRGGDM